MAQEKKLSIRDLIIEVTGRPGYTGTAQMVADRIHRNVQDEAADGYIFVPHLTPHGLDDFFDPVVPILQERGSFRADYEGPTLRDHLGLGPASTGAGVVGEPDGGQFLQHRASDDVVLAKRGGVSPGP